MPLLKPKWWHSNYPNVSLFLAGLIACLYSFGYAEGNAKLLHSGLEYLSFIALIGGLFFVASCIKVRVTGSGRPTINTLLLAFGAILANVLGTTGASMLLIRPFIKINQHRIRPLHIVFFIIIVSNCGGALTPIGDPPLYLGYLKGVPFTWTLLHLWPSWLVVVSSLLLMYLCYDFFYVDKRKNYLHLPKHLKISIEGKLGLISLLLMILAVFIDPLASSLFDLKHIPLTAPTQILIATYCFLKTKPEIKTFNTFSFEPFKEVSLLFIGIFITMIPALDYLSAHGPTLGINSPMTYFWGSGSLSAVLDNAPTYLNFLQIAIGEHEINAQTIAVLISTEVGNLILIAISSGAVFFGALSYIGNGPNFMVRSISEAQGIKTPSFFGYIFRASCILLPILILHALIFF